MTNSEINIKCAEAMGWKLVSYDKVPAATKADYQHAASNDGWMWDGRDGDEEAWNWNPSESIADAWVLVEWANEHEGQFEIEVTNAGFDVDVWHKPAKTWLDGEIRESTAPLAICRAFLAWSEQRKEAP